MTTNKTSQTITLKDGRTLGFAEYGDLKGKPIFHFPGSGGSRLEHPTEDSSLAGIRYISTDRPGLGLSDYQPRRKLIDWPEDVAQLADYLGIDKFHVLGWSAGGPHALACAYKLPDRVIASALVAGFAPTNRPGARENLPLPNRILMIIARSLPWAVGPVRRIMRSMILGDAEKATQRFLASIPEADKHLISDTKNADMLFKDIREGLRPGWRGVARDDIIINQDWGFNVKEIKVRIDIWQGDADMNVPLHAGEYLRDHIPNTQVTFLPGEGHFLILKHWREILEALVS